MKQLHVVGSFPNGTQTFVQWQLRGALDMGYQPAVLAANTGNEAGYKLAGQLGLSDVPAIYANYRTTSPWHLDLRRFSPGVARAADKARYGRVLAERRKSFFCSLLTRPEIRNVDLIQVHFSAWAIEVGLPLAHLLGRPCVVTAHGAVSHRPADDLRFLQETADAVVVVSDSEKRDWIDRTGSDRKLHRVWNGLPIAGLPQRNRDDSLRGLALATIGRLSPEKRIGDLIRAVAELRDRGRTVSLNVFGEGGMRGALEKLISQLDLVDRVNMPGNVPHEQVMRRLSQSDVLLHASESEPFGLAMIEGMAAGLPVVAARSNGAAEILEHGKTGFIYEPGDVASLVDYILCLADDSELNVSMGHAGRRRVEQEFSLEAHMRNMDRIWQSALHG